MVSRSWNLFLVVTYTNIWIWQQIKTCHHMSKMIIPNIFIIINETFFSVIVVWFFIEPEIESFGIQIKVPFGFMPNIAYEMSAAFLSLGKKKNVRPTHATFSQLACHTFPWFLLGQHLMLCQINKSQGIQKTICMDSIKQKIQQFSSTIKILRSIHETCALYSITYEEAFWCAEEFYKIWKRQKRLL